MKALTAIILVFLAATVHAGRFRLDNSYIEADTAAVVTGTQSGQIAQTSTALTTETNRAIVAEAGLSASIAGVNVTATNAATNSLLAIAVINAEVAKGNINASFASNLIYTIISSVSTTQRVGHADTAGALVMPDGSENRFWFDATNLYVICTTNTASLIVTGTTGEGYNGPAEGTVFTYDSVWQEGVWYSYSGSDPTWTMLVSFAGDIFNIYDDAQTPTKEWDSQPPFPANATASPLFGGIGVPTLDWVPNTTTQNIPIVAAPASLSTVLATGNTATNYMTVGAVSTTETNITNTLRGILELRHSGITTVPLQFLEHDSSYWGISVGTKALYIRKGGNQNTQGLSLDGQSSFNGTLTVASHIVIDAFKDRQNQIYYVDPASTVQSVFVAGPILTTSGKVQLGSTNCWVVTDGTNLFFRNVNGSVTNLTNF